MCTVRGVGSCYVASGLYGKEQREQQQIGRQEQTEQLIGQGGDSRAMDRAARKVAERTGKRKQSNRFDSLVLL